jgi:hypothetical protein
MLDLLSVHPGHVFDWRGQLLFDVLCWINKQLWRCAILLSHVFYLAVAKMDPS